jgi:hypothetical protein
MRAAADKKRAAMNSDGVDGVHGEEATKVTNGERADASKHDAKE